MAARETEDTAVGDIWEDGTGNLFMTVGNPGGECAGLSLLCLRAKPGTDKVGKLYAHIVSGWQKVGHFDGI